MVLIDQPLFKFLPDNSDFYISFQFIPTMTELHLSSLWNILLSKMSGKPQFCLYFIFIALNPLFPQEYQLSGKVIDRTTKQVLNTVSVLDKSTLKGVISDNFGKFNILLPAGRHNFEFSYMGYQRVDTAINLTENTEIVIFMNSLVYQVDEITITAEKQKDNVTSRQMGAFTLSNKEIVKFPYIMGETDPLKILQLTPGVQSTSNVGVGFYVRGGGVDQNLILYDNTIIYNPGHLLGIFSVFNSDLIKNVSIVKSGIPAQYGGKLSSVIRVNSYMGNRDSIEVKGSIGLISSRLSVGGPLFKGKGSFIAGARRTYLELLVKPIISSSASETSFLNKESIYNFHDFNLGASVDISLKDNISFSGYKGRDRYRMDHEGVKQENLLSWGNSMASLSWNHVFKESCKLKTSISWTKYDFNLSGSQGEYFFGLFSSVEDYTLKSELSFNKEKSLFNTGIELTEHSFIPNTISARSGDFNLKFGQFGTMKAVAGALFFNEEYTFSPRFSVAGGLRLSFFNLHGPYTDYIRDALGQVSDSIIYSPGKSIVFYYEPEPRFVFKYQINKSSSVKASYMHIAQYVHLATSASASMPTDIWVPSTAKIKPLIGDQLSFGYFRNFPKDELEFSAEVYFKKMNNQLEFLRGIVNISVDGNIQDNMEIGDGQAYGAEFYLAKKYGNLTGWLSYTLARTEQRFDEINAGYFYPAKYDRRHDITLTMSRKISEKWSGSMVFVYTSGNAFTMPVGRYIIQGNVVNQYGKVNSFRMPANHRMDVSFTRKIASRRIKDSELVFSIYNVYNRSNPYYIYYEIVGDVEKYSLKVKAFEVNLLPIIPSMSWNFKF